MQQQDSDYEADAYDESGKQDGAPAEKSNTAESPEERKAKAEAMQM